MNDQSARSECPEWDPLTPDALEDQRRSYDDLRSRCPVAHSDQLGWSALRHADVLGVLPDHDTYRSHVSQHQSVPNGTDPPEHAPYRRLIEPYFAPDPMDAFGHEFAVRVQCAFMGWSHDLHEPLRAWVREQHRAALAEDRDALAASARTFDEVVRDVLDARRAADTDAPDDPTTRLIREFVDGRPLTDAEIVGIVRN